MPSRPFAGRSHRLSQRRRRRRYNRTLTFTYAAALLIPAVSGLSTAAFADDEYGVAMQHGDLIR